jgi:hypothetical protein
MMKKTLYFVCSSVLFLSTACGKEASSAKSGSEIPEDKENLDSPADQANLTVVVDSASGLPACAAGNNNQLVYVKDTLEFKVCSSGAWAAISIKGEKGDAGGAGAKGDSGAKGDKGDSGVGMTITRVVSCPSSNDLGTDDIRSGGGADITKFADGSFFITCSSYMIDSSYADSHASSTFWPATSNGVVNGQIGCYPYFVAVKFNIAAGTAQYYAQDDVTKTETVTCEEVYPGAG